MSDAFLRLFVWVQAWVIHLNARLEQWKEKA